MKEPYVNRRLALVLACLVAIGLAFGVGVKDSCLSSAAKYRFREIPVIPARTGAGAVALDGRPLRTFNKKIERQRHTHAHRRKLLAGFLAAVPPPRSTCRKWAVLTTVASPGCAIDRLRQPAAVSDGWCVVVVADAKSPPRSTYPADIVYLSFDDQKRCASVFRTAAISPTHNYSRKNMGYLYAMANGAEAIFDTEDNSALFLNASVPIRIPGQANYRTTQAGTILGTSVFNPYPHFGGDKGGNWWPRGFPVEKVSDHTTHPRWHPYFKPTTDESFVVQHSLADRDPDVDAIFRMTRRERKMIWEKNVWPVYPPAGVLSPYNSQATVVLPGGFWSLVLPSTVESRVSDIWRSYWAQRLMWDVNQRVLFVPSFVEQNRTAHDVFADYQAELQIYQQADTLCTMLGSWDGSKVVADGPDTLPRRAVDLAIWMYERGFWEENDVFLIDAWFDDLTVLDYKFPRTLAGADSYVDGLRTSVRRRGESTGCVPVLVDESEIGELTRTGILSGLAEAQFIGSKNVPLFFFVQSIGRRALESLIQESVRGISRPVYYEIFEIDGYHFHAPPRAISGPKDEHELNGITDRNMTQSAGYTWCSQFLAYDMYMHPRLREFKYVWRLDQDVRFRPCASLPEHYKANCTRFLRSGPFSLMEQQHLLALDLQTGPYSKEAVYVTSHLLERANMVFVANGIQPLNWDMHLVAGYSETVNQWALFQTPKYYAFLQNIHALSDGIWSLAWREQAIKSVWILGFAASSAIGDRWKAFYPTLSHKGQNSSYLSS
jgi:hypothetical protein